MSFDSNKPRVSILMPVKNSLPYLEGAINSILEQTMENFELIIINDHSNDGSYDYIRSLTDHRIKAYSLSSSSGIVAASNYGLRMARSSLIARMDSDDIAKPERLQTQIDFMESNKNIVLVASNISIISESGFDRQAMELKHWYNTAHTNDEIKQQFFLGNCINHPSTIYKKQAAFQCGLYQEGYPGAADYDFLLRLKKTGYFYKISQPLLTYRVHKNQVSQRKLKQQRLSDARLKVRLLQESNLLENKKIILIGGGKGGKLILDQLLNQKIQDVSILDKDKQKWGQSISGIRIIGGEEQIKQHLDHFFIIATSPGRKYYEAFLTDLGLKSGIDYQSLWF